MNHQTTHLRGKTLKGLGKPPSPGMKKEGLTSELRFFVCRRMSLTPNWSQQQPEDAPNFPNLCLPPSYTLPFSQPEPDVRDPVPRENGPSHPPKPSETHVKSLDASGFRGKWVSWRVGDVAMVSWTMGNPRTPNKARVEASRSGGFVSTETKKLQQV